MHFHSGDSFHSRIQTYLIKILSEKYLFENIKWIQMSAIEVTLIGNI